MRAHLDAESACDRMEFLSAKPAKEMANVPPPAPTVVDLEHLLDFKIKSRDPEDEAIYERAPAVVTAYEDEDLLSFRITF